MTVVDGSDSISDPDFIKLKSVLTFLANRLHIEPDGAHMGIVVYSTHIALEFDLSSNLTAILQQIESLPHPKYGTMTDLGIKKMREIFQNHAHSHLRDVPTIGLVITDGNSKFPERTAAEAAATKAANITMYAVGVGNIKRTELLSIASSPDHILKVSSFNALLSHLEKLVKLICPSKLVYI